MAFLKKWTSLVCFTMKTWKFRFWLRMAVYIVLIVWLLHLGWNFHCTQVNNTIYVMSFKIFRWNYFYNKEKYNCSGTPSFWSQRVGYKKPKTTALSSALKKFAQFIYPFLSYSRFQSHELKGNCHFWPIPPKNCWINFQLSWICTKI